MNAATEWATIFATQLLMEDEPAVRTKPTTLEQRISIGLLQARAQECRQMAGELQIKGLLDNQVMKLMWSRLLNRSSELESEGMKLATEWPVKTIEVVQ